MSGLFADLTWRGLIYQVTDPAVEELLDRGGLTAYIGFDPTANSLHVGNLLQLFNLRRLQNAGHRPIVLAGGATGMIGDPSFKSAERSLLDEDTLASNVASVQVQLRQFLDFDANNNAAILVNNADWTKPIGVIDFLRDIGKHFTVNSLIARESVRARLEDREQGISFTEFSYSLLQANDFLHLYETHDCSVQLGASDQWGNIVSGVDLIRRRLGKHAYGVCSPLVVKADGTKFGKTETGTVWLSAERTSPYQFYQFFLRTEDASVVQYLKYFTFLPRERITELEASVVSNPKAREAQRVLADEVTRVVHGEAEVEKARRAAEALFSEEINALDESTLLDVFADAPSASFAKSVLDELPLIDALVETGLCSSKSAARTAIAQGGVSVNNRRNADVNARLSRADALHGAYVVLRRGKREFAVARFS